MMPVIFPVRSSRAAITQGPGADRGHGRRHKGTDIGGRIGDPIASATDGTVLRLFRDGHETTPERQRIGNGIAILDGDRWVHIYAHFRDPVRSPDLQPGKTVHAGQLIGVLGETGDATGPHLHYQITHGQRVIDPRSALEAGLVAMRHTGGDTMAEDRPFTAEEREAFARNMAPVLAPPARAAGSGALILLGLGAAWYFTKGKR